MTKLRRKASHIVAYRTGIPYRYTVQVYRTDIPYRYTVRGCRMGIPDGDVEAVNSFRLHDAHTGHRLTSN